MLPEQQVEAQRGETKELLKVDLRVDLKEKLKTRKGLIRKCVGLNKALLVIGAFLR